MSKLEPKQQIAKEDFKSSSSNNVYTTVLYDNCISCNCPAGGKKSVCKHMVSLIHSNLEAVKEKNSEFYNDLQLLLEMKNNKNKDLEEFKKLCDKLIYINKDIAEKAFENSQVINKNSKRVLEKYISDIEKTNIYSQFELFNLLGLAFNNYEQGFRYTEFPQKLAEYIDLGFIVATECTSLKDFRKMERGPKSNYYFKFSEEFKPLIRKIRKELSVKFPTIQETVDGVFYVEKRIIDPKYLTKDNHEQ